MSRWIEQFKNHTFHTTWTLLKERLAGSKIDDVTITTYVKELSRLKKVITYIDGLIDDIDPELVPLSLWDSFNDQATQCSDNIKAFNSNRNIGHVQNANAHADNLLSYVRPYMATKGALGKALKDAAISYSETIDKIINDIGNSSKQMLTQAEENNISVEEVLTSVKKHAEEIESTRDALLGDDENPGISKELEKIHSDATVKYDELSSYYNDTLVGSAKTLSTKQEILDAKDEALSQKESILEIRDQVTDEVESLEEFHEKMFGKADANGERSGGLSYDFDQRVLELGKFEKEQRTKYIALNSEIETLLPGATSAGLATAYKNLKVSFNDPIKNANRIFFVAVGLMIFGAFYTTVESVGWFYISFLKVSDWSDTFKTLAHKIPYFAPVIWLGYYATKRRSEFQRLQQEYAHKEALASSYHSYKQQLKDLDSEDSEMQKAFIIKAIDSMAHNASETLDGKHGDKMPAHELLELLKSDTLWDVLKKKSGLSG